MNSPSPEHAAHEHHHAMPHATEVSGNAHSAHDRHEGHSVAMFRDRFWITLLLSIPTLLWSGMVQHMFGFSAPAFPGSAVHSRALRHRRLSSTAARSSSRADCENCAIDCPG